MVLSAVRRTSLLSMLVSLAAIPVLAEESKGALQFSLDYTAEAWTTLARDSSGTAYLDNLDAVLEADLEALAGWDDTRAVVYALYNNGSESGAATSATCRASRTSRPVSTPRGCSRLLWRPASVPGARSSSGCTT